MKKIDIKQNTKIGEYFYSMGDVTKVYMNLPLSEIIEDNVATGLIKNGKEYRLMAFDKAYVLRHEEKMSPREIKYLFEEFGLNK